MKAECLAYGAHVLLVDGLIDDCGKVIRAGAAAYGWCDVSTLREPYRAEGKKTMGLEIAEQLDWRYPMLSSIPPGAVPASSACGKRLPNWRPWVLSVLSDQR